MFHKHIWKEEERFYAEPVGHLKSSILPDYVVERLALGVTTIKLVCQDPDCGHIKAVEILGKSLREKV